MKELPDDHLPRLQAQLSAHQANPEWPHFGRDALDHGHAVFTIADHLRILGLQAWTNRLLKWLAHYDGFERYVEEDAHDPVLCVRDLLMRHVIGQGQKGPGPVGREHADAQQAWQQECKHLIVNDILRQEFLRYRAFWGANPMPQPISRHWQPMEQSWLSFIENHRPGELLWVWLSPREPKPSLSLLRAHLLGA